MDEIASLQKVNAFSVNSLEGKNKCLRYLQNQLKIHE